MNDPATQELIHADIDGELNGAQRAQLARALLSDPEARALHDDLKRLSASLDVLPVVEPPPDLMTNILSALPQPTAGRARPAWWVEHRWRYAALVAGVLAAGTLVFETVHGPGSDSAEMTGTLATGSAILDAAALPPGGELSGRVVLYRDGTGLGLRFQLAGPGPVNASISSGGQTLQVNDLAAAADPPERTVPLRKLASGQEIKVALRLGGRPAGDLSLRVP